MENFQFFNQEHIQHYLKARKGETKFGQALSVISSVEELENVTADFVIFGIPEDIGVRANQGIAGTANAWDSFLHAFLNIQKNQYNYPENCLILGQVGTEKFMQRASLIPSSSENYHEQLGEIVSEIDNEVSQVVSTIVASGKIPVIIGGGHNNAYGNIKGASEALEKPINVLNIDAHTDFRTTEYRHSGNGFSYAKEEEILNRYALVGVHKNYTPHYIFETMDADKKITYSLFEDYIHLTAIDKLIKIKKSADFVKNHFGLEVDCDAIENFSSSAMTPSGFTINEVRSFIKLMRKQEVIYLHLCEASPQKNPQIGKALSYFVSDFIRREE